MIKKSFNEDEFSALIERIDLARGDMARFGSLVKLLLLTGARVDELCSMKVGDVEATGRVHIRDAAKGSHKRSQFIPVGLADCIRAHARNCGMVESDLLVGLVHKSKDSSVVARKKKIQRLWHKLRGQVGGGLGAMGLHSTRHTAIEKIYRASGNDIRAAQLFAGHKSIASTQHYINHIDSESLRGIAHEAFSEMFKTKL